MISRLSSTLLCGGQPARGPTSGSEAYLYSVSASLSRQGRRMILSVSIVLIVKSTAKIHFFSQLGKNRAGATIFSV